MLTAVGVKAESGPTSIVIVPPPASALISKAPPLAVVFVSALVSVEFPMPLFRGNGVARGSDKAWENAKTVQKSTKQLVERIVAKDARVCDGYVK